MANSRGSLSFAAISILALLIPSGCQPDPSSREFAEKTMGGSAGLLPGPPAVGEIRFSQYQPETESQELTTGLLSQTAFDTAGETAAAAPAQSYRVEVRNLLVGPGKSTAEATLPGAAVFEVRSGNGTVTIGSASQEITTGSTFAVSEGESFRLTNSSEMGLALRVYVIRLQ